MTLNFDLLTPKLESFILAQNASMLKVGKIQSSNFQDIALTSQSVFPAHWTHHDLEL